MYSYASHEGQPVDLCLPRNVFSPNSDASITADRSGEASPRTVQGVCPPGGAKEPGGGQCSDCVTYCWSAYVVP